MRQTRPVKPIGKPARLAGRTGLVGMWLLAAVSATALGLGAVQLLDDGLGAADASTVALNSGANASPAPTTSAGGAAKGLAHTAQLHTDGGDVYATCTSTEGRASASGVPSAGWTVQSSDSGSTIEFRNGSRRLRVESSCTSAGPVLVQTRNDDGTGSSSTSPSTGPSNSASAVPSTAPATGDDPPGDDHGGQRASSTAAPSTSASTSTSTSTSTSAKTQSSSNASPTVTNGSGKSGSGGHGTDD
jgi:hypothetical protein